MATDKIYSKAELNKMIMIAIGAVVIINATAWVVSISPTTHFGLLGWHTVVIDLAFMFMFMAVMIYVQPD